MNLNKHILAITAMFNGAIIACIFCVLCKFIIVPYVDSAISRIHIIQQHYWKLKNSLNI